MYPDDASPEVLRAIDEAMTPRRPWYLRWLGRRIGSLEILATQEELQANGTTVIGLMIGHVTRSEFRAVLRAEIGPRTPVYWEDIVARSLAQDLGELEQAGDGMTALLEAWS